MKKVLLSALALVIATCAFAQKKKKVVPVDTGLKPGKGLYGVGLRLSAFNATAINAWNANAFINSSEGLARYYVTDKIVARVGLGINNFSAKFDTTLSQKSAFGGTDPAFKDKITTTVTKGSRSQTSSGFLLNPGLEYHFAGTDKLDPYVGAQISFGKRGDTTLTTSKDISRTLDENSLNLGASKTVTKVVTPGGTLFGFAGIVGFNYFFADKFAVGAEYSLGFLNSNVGGKQITTATSDISVLNDPNNPNSGLKLTNLKTPAVERTITNSTTSIQLRNTAGIHLSYFFK